eukprot:CAMPEP_0198139978 /NCGR_PEP_ID=MMETSP1443-20131203/3213_1 /TAXON_ID=186043 /ORGANISM="Entomoneis sp., Strain CCMP2396" /LENGTH=304 /DNA_ID=CAMNT_0043802275 /DNA_START=57 /DNA_END=968 /DNA_ORIENTATION=+
MKNNLQKNEGLLDVLVLDSSAPYAMAQIFHTIAARSKNRGLLFSDNFLVLAPIVEPEDNWRRGFLNKFWAMFRSDATVRSDIIFTTEKKRVEVGIFSSVDNMYNHQVLDVTRSIQGRLNITGHIHNLKGGLPVSTDYSLPNISLYSDYDLLESYSQWTSQTQVGFQTIIQMEMQDRHQRIRLKTEKTRLSREKIRSLFDKAFAEVKVKRSMEPHQFNDLGDGCSIAAFWPRGSVVVLWDGGSHVGINWFTLDEDDEFTSSFVGQFTRLTLLKVVLRDVIPRGLGRIVSISADSKQKQNNTGPAW